MDFSKTEPRTFPSGNPDRIGVPLPRYNFRTLTLPACGVPPFRVRSIKVLP